MFAYLTKKRKEKQKENEKKLINALTNCHVNEWSAYDEKYSMQVEKQPSGDFIVLLDQYSVQNTGSPDYGYSMREVRKKRPKKRKEITRLSQWGKILTLNELFHKAYLLDQHALPKRYQELIKQCETALIQLEKEDFREDGTKEAFNVLKQAVERNLLDTREH